MRRRGVLVLLGSALLLGPSGCTNTQGPENHAPVIQAITASPGTVPTGGVVTVSCIATDEDGDQLAYAWTSPAGGFPAGTQGAAVQYQAPSAVGVFTCTVVVSDGRLTDEGDVAVEVVASTGSVEGHVYQDGARGPIAGVTVSIGSISSDTNQAGYYSLQGVVTGLRAITAACEGYGSYSDTITVVYGVRERDIYLPPESTVGTVTGCVYLVDTSTTLSGVVVSIGAATYTTAGDGYYELGDVPIGTQWILAEKDGYLSYSEEVAVTSGQNDHTVYLVPETGTVQGTVYAVGTSTPLAGVVVNIGSATHTTLQDGGYVLAAIPVGAQTIEAEKDGFSDYSAQIQVHVGVNEHAIYLTSDIQTTNLYGYVSNSQHAPMQGAWVAVAGMEQQTSATGYYQFPSVPQGQQHLVVTAELYDEWQQTLYLYQSDYQYDVGLVAAALPPPAGVHCSASYDGVEVEWDARTEQTVSGYNVYRSEASAGPYEKINPALVGSSWYIDSSCLLETDYYYKVSSVNIDQVEGELSDYAHCETLPHIQVTSDFGAPDVTGITWDGTHFYTTSYVDWPNERIEKRNSIGQILQTFPSPSEDHFLRELAFDGTDIWVVEDDANAYRIDRATGDVLQVLGLQNIVDDRIPIEFINGILYYSCANPEVIGVNPVTGQIVDGFGFGLGRIDGMAWDGQFLWLAYASNIAKYDLAANEVLNTYSTPNSIDGAFGLAVQGSYLWTTKNSSNRCYQFIVHDNPGRTR
jgi:hypothetical protein